MENKHTHTLSTDMVVMVPGIYYTCIYVGYYYYSNYKRKALSKEDNPID
jgi:hypothetical protein